jgi:hypothetical protein
VKDENIADRCGRLIKDRPGLQLFSGRALRDDSLADIAAGRTRGRFDFSETLHGIAVACTELFSERGFTDLVLTVRGPDGMQNEPLLPGALFRCLPTRRNFAAFQDSVSSISVIILSASDGVAAR